MFGKTILRKLIVLFEKERKYDARWCWNVAKLLENIVVGMAISVNGHGKRPHWKSVGTWKLRITAIFLSGLAAKGKFLKLSQRKSLAQLLMDDTDLLVRVPGWPGRSGSGLAEWADPRAGQWARRCHAVTVGVWQTQLEWKVSPSAS